MSIRITEGFLRNNNQTSKTKQLLNGKNFDNIQVQNSFIYNKMPTYDIRCDFETGTIPLSKTKYCQKRNKYTDNDIICVIGPKSPIGNFDFNYFVCKSCGNKIFTYIGMNLEELD